jgi:hypothetical protein
VGRPLNPIKGKGNNLDREEVVIIGENRQVIKLQILAGNDKLVESSQVHLKGHKRHNKEIHQGSSLNPKISHASNPKDHQEKSLLKHHPVVEGINLREEKLSRNQVNLT